MTRTFISVDIPDEIKENIREIQKQLPEFKGKLTESENLHLTLKFFGEIEENKVEEVRKKLKEINFLKFKTEINSIGVFSPKFVKIVWLHMSNCGELQREIDEKLSNFFPKEKRFMSHLTIARVKSIKSKKDFLNRIERVKIPQREFVVSNFLLKKSTLAKNGPIYETLEEFKLN